MSEGMRSAMALIEQHGKDAARVAHQRAENAGLAGSPGAARIWHRVADTIRIIEELKKIDRRESNLRRWRDLSSGAAPEGLG